MKKSILLVLVLICFNLASAQIVSIKNTIHFNEIYSAESTTCTDSFMELKVSSGKSKIHCTLKVNQQEIHGYLVRNTDKVNRDNYKELYNFFIPKHIHPLLVINFYNEDNKAMALVLNQTYLKIFKPCFEVKGIELTLKNTGTDAHQQ